MTDTLFYSIVKLVPHPIREESINLGVVVVSEEGDFAEYRFSRGIRERLRALAPDVNPAIVDEFVEGFGDLLRPHDSGKPMAEPTPETLAELADHFAYQFQVT